MKPLASLAPLILPIFAGANDDSSSIPRPTATLESGVVFGVQTSLPNALWPVKKFLGVPYAGKPERFSRAKKHRGWKKARGATEFGPSCHQYFVDNGMNGSLAVVGYANRRCQMLLPEKTSTRASSAASPPKAKTASSSMHSLPRLDGLVGEQVVEPHRLLGLQLELRGDRVRREVVQSHGRRTLPGAWC